MFEVGKRWWKIGVISIDVCMWYSLGCQYKHKIVPFGSLFGQNLWLKKVTSNNWKELGDEVYGKNLYERMEVILLGKSLERRKVSRN